MATEKEAFTLYLAPWQVRMAKDFIKGRAKKYVKMRLKPGLIKCPASYKIPVRGLKPGDWVLYLTDEQMSIITEKFGLKTAISGINITDELIVNKSVEFIA